MRVALPNARIMVHQPSGGARGMASDIEIQAKEILRIRKRMNDLYVAMLGGGKVTMVSNRIANDIELFFSWGAASALGVVLLVITLAVLVVAARLSRGAGLFGAGH